MKRICGVIVLCLSLFAFPAELPAGETTGTAGTVSHDLKIVLVPGEHRFWAKDTITVPDRFQGEFHFLLHRGLEPSSPTPGVSISREADEQGKNIYESFRVALPAGQNVFEIAYEGTIYHPVEALGKEQARGVRQTPGIISEEGVYLAGSSFWYPFLETSLVSFTLEVELPQGWEAVSQGERTEHLKKGDRTLVRWESPEPQDEIYLVAARFTEYERPAGHVSAMAFLRLPDEGLANKYLEATARYITMYGKLIGPYPYKKFALVENFWETGYGMPSFTLLGPTVIRLPFIINSSYPHEILHNWWGNSVFPEYSSGNWSEGLTAYLSDHLIREQQGSAAEYRQTTLQKYTDYVRSEKEFPLSGFRSRHSTSSEAVGYGKSLMFFHMLRLELGDKIFIDGLHDFYRRNKFRFASFNDIRKSFASVSGKELTAEFDQWVGRTGAPKIQLVSAKTEKEGDGYVLELAIGQDQADDGYLLQIPLAVTMEGEVRAWQTVAKMDQKRIDLHFHLPSRPVRVDLDPEFDLFRRLDLGEIPPAISQALGAKKMLVILPSSADDTMLQAYRNFSSLLAGSGPDEVEVMLDTGIKEFPSDRSVTVLGWENRFIDKVTTALAGYDVKVAQKSVLIGSSEISGENNSVVLTGRNPKNREMAVMFIGAGPAGALPGLGRKLPHYHKYSYLVFEGGEPVNVNKGRWPVLDSPMTAVIPFEGGTLPKVEMGGLAARGPLAALPPAFSKERMTGTIGHLAKPEFAGRGLGTEGLDRAAGYIAERFREAGLEPAGDEKEGYFQTWEEDVEGLGQAVRMTNVIGVIPGKNPEFAGQSLVIGAHYDHLGLGWPDVRGNNSGRVHPGSDDNASGVALLIELAGELRKNLVPERSIIFVAFTGEEAGKRGSQYYVAQQKQYPVEKCIGMLNLDTVGRLGKKKLLVLGAGSAREWIHIFRGASYVTGVETEMVSEELDSSDQISFEAVGIPAVQLFTGPQPDYHRPSDSADKIDGEGLEKVAAVAKEVIEYLAGREEALTGAVKKNGRTDSSQKQERKVSLGTIPDYTFSGRGCRISGVMPDTPAEACGLIEGDVIIRINSAAVGSLKEYSDVLKSLSPGATITITFLRDGKEMAVEAVVRAK
ncbi:MAG: M20/M25/M40 family metallo-hydrolase [Nitrospirota bacterium]|nr:M20/M25/M40 family metallo-hydrolase [Nitrospirota bacterium]